MSRGQGLSVATELDMLNALDSRYTKIRRGTSSDRFVKAWQVRTNLTAHGGYRVIDHVALDKFSSSIAIHGHEVKVSRSDLRTELADPDKAATEYCTHWWLVLSDKAIANGLEIPETWGILAPRGNSLFAYKPAPNLPAPRRGDPQFVTCLAQGVETRHKRLRPNCPARENLQH